MGLHISGGLQLYLEPKWMTVTYLDRPDKHTVYLKLFQDNLIIMKVVVFSIDHLSSPAGLLYRVTSKKS